MKNLSDKILNKISRKEIKPIPRGFFVLKNYGFWLLAFLFVVIGSLSVSLLSYNIISKDWDIYGRLNESLLGFIISSLPYLWILVSIISIIIVVFNLEHSKNGYRYSPLKFILLSLTISIVLGLAGYGLGLGQKLDDTIGKIFPTYSTVEAQKQRTWNQPSKGLFSGKILSTEKDIFRLEDFSGKVWTVNYSGAIVKGNSMIQAGSQVKVIGTISDQNNIDASEIRPWGNMMNGRSNGHRVNINERKNYSLRNN